MAARGCNPVSLSGIIPAAEGEIRRLASHEGEPVRLTYNEFHLLAAFLASPQRVLSRDQILELSRLSNDEVCDRSVDVLAARGAVPEVVDDGSTGIVCETADQLVEAIPRIRALSRNACRQTAEARFSQTALVDGYESIYQDVVARHSKSPALVEAADLALFVTTATRYADRVPWAVLDRVRERGLPLQVIVNRMPPDPADRADILADVHEAVASGRKEIQLLGQIVNHYQAPDDARCDFTGLLEAVHTVNGIERIRFASPHPRHFDDRFLGAMAQLPKICRHLHLPVQSGSTRILQAMRRRHSREQRRIDRSRAGAPAQQVLDRRRHGLDHGSDPHARGLERSLASPLAVLFAAASSELSQRLHGGPRPNGLARLRGLRSFLARRLDEPFDRRVQRNPRMHATISNTFIPNDRWVVNVLVGGGYWKEEQRSQSFGRADAADMAVRADQPWHQHLAGKIDRLGAGGNFDGLRHSAEAQKPDNPRDRGSPPSFRCGAMPFLLLASRTVASFRWQDGSSVQFGRERRPVCNRLKPGLRALLRPTRQTQCQANACWNLHSLR